MVHITYRVYDGPYDMADLYCEKILTMKIINIENEPYYRMIKYPYCRHHNHIRTTLNNYKCT